MKSLCIIAIGTLVAFGPAESFAQGWKDKIGLTKKGKVKAENLTEEDHWTLLGGPKEDDGPVSTFHSSNNGKVVFTTSKMEAKDVTAATAKSSINLNEPIYFSFFLPKSMQNHIYYPLDDAGNYRTDYSYDYSFKKWYPGPGVSSHNNGGVPVLDPYGSMKVKMYCDGKPADVNAYLNINLAHQYNATTTAFSGTIYADPTKQDPASDVIKFMQELSDGNHEVKIEIWGEMSAQGSEKKRVKENNGIVAEGSFTLVKKSGEVFGPKYDLSWADCKANMTDKDLEAKMLKAVQDFGAKNGYKEKFDAVKIKSEDWIIVRHKISGVVTNRNLIGLCRSTWPNGQCKVQRYVFIQDHNGSDFQSSIYCVGIEGRNSPQAIDCD